MWQEFKEFALKGNFLELAIAFVMGVAFSAVVTSLVDDIIMQLIAAIFGEADFSSLTVTLNNSEIRYGSFLTALVVFLQVAIALFIIVKLVQKLRRESPPEEATEPGEDVLLLREIRDALVADRRV